jgi:large repetitive protein
MQNERALSETVSTILVIALILILAIVTYSMFYGSMPFQQKATLVSSEIKNQSVNGKNIISVFHRAGDPFYLNSSFSGLHQMSIYLDNRSNSTRAAPVLGLDIVKPGTTLLIYYNTSKNVYRITSDASLMNTGEAQSVYECPLKVRLVDETAKILISTWNWTCVPPTPPTVTSLSPASGTRLGGTTVTITGTGFSSPATVSFGSTPGTSVTVVSPTQITVRSPARPTGGTVDVTVTTVGGTSPVVPGDRFTYTGVAPVVTSITPTSGSVAGGTTVTITGTGFTSASTVRFGTTAGTSMTFVSDTQITIRSPARAAGLVDIRVTTVGGTSAIVAADQFTYFAVPVITSLSPNSGPSSGGTLVTITGTGFTNTSAVSFGGTAGTGMNFVSATQITVLSPPSVSGGTVDVRITTIGGTSAIVAADRFTYTGFVPTITSLSPSSGTRSGGTTVTITGTGFTSASTVSFGGTAGTSITFINTTRLTVRSPARSAGGTVDVTVTTVGGTSAIVPEDQFTYTGIAPTVTGLAPASGPAGTLVTITGTGFTSASTVSFGGTAATSVTFVNTTRLTALSPSGSAGGTVDVRVTTVGGTSAIVTADRYTYSDGPPTITGISPANGPLAGGTTVTITGTGFTSATTVSFGGTSGTSVTFISATQISARSPAHAAGVVDVTVTTVGGTSGTSAADQFTYLGAPTVTGLSPANGPATTPVTITGIGFTSASTVSFGGTAATSVTFVSGTQITAVAPTRPSGGTVDVRVTTVGGTSAIVAVDRFTYTDTAPTVTSITPVSGSAAGGTTVTINGAGFTSASTVSFSGTAGTSVTFVSATRLTARSPAHAVGVVDVTVTTVGGTSGTSAASQFTYLPAVTSRTPTSGPAAGGTTVTINGAGFTSGSTVTFGSSAAAGMTYVSPTRITAVSPPGTAGAVVDIRVNTAGYQSAVITADRFTYV